MERTSWAAMSDASRAKSSEPKDLEWGRELTDLTAAQIETFLAFRGYVNPNGRFWFIGMEEDGKSTIENLRIRAEKFDRLEDLERSHRNFNSHDMNKLTTSTWGLMLSIVGRMSSEPNWWSTDVRRAYQSTKLGRLNGETYLTEVRPLPKKGINDWPYGDFFDSPEDYFERIFPDQLMSIRSDYGSANPKPQFVFCYGKSYWDRHPQVFELIDFESTLDGSIQWGRNETTVFLLTNFFDYSRMGFTENFVDRLREFALSKSPK